MTIVEERGVLVLHGRSAVTYDQRVVEDGETTGLRVAVPASRKGEWIAAKDTRYWVKY